MELIRNFTKLGKDDAPIAGGKGASLGEMTQAGIPVPPGFVVLSQAFEQFLHETSLAEEIDAAIDAVDHKEIHTVEKASETIKELILSREMPQDIKTEIEKNFAELNTQFVAVRSSATAEDGKDHAWAGQLESYLNTTEADLLEKVKHCWASLFTPRAIFYRFEKGLHNTKISVAVVVQKMVESEVSGIAFSVHPVTEDHNQLIIEAGFGLGEAIVSGTVTPDSYIVEKNPRRIIDINVAEQVKGLYRVASVSNGGNEWRDLGEKGKTQVLTETQILELSEIILNIEKHYGFPCDIEWAYEAGKFYIVQSRPITTLSAKVQTVQTCSLNYADYVQLFSGNSMSFLMSDLFIQYYKHLDGLTTFAHNKWTSWLPKKRMEKTLQEGIELFGNKEAFEKFKKEITEYYDSAFTVFESILSMGHLSKDDCALFLKKMTENFEHYSKTEFFYVDEAFKISEGNNVIKDNFKDFEEIKNGSRLKVNKMFFQPDSYRKQFMAKVGTQFNLTKDQVSTYGRDDILALCDGVRLSDQMVEERLKSYLMKGDSGNVEYSYGDVSEKIIDYFFSQATSNLDNILKGVVAHSGKAKGRAAVIKYGDNMFQRLPEIIRDMPQGSILVTDTTSPELFMACKKASAIVTNQGGMMSHAAIVSRELNIPCLVGVGVATDRINDGDMIEVDADNGVVRILTENKPNPLFIDGKNWFPTVTRNMSFWHQGLCNEGTCDHAADFGVDYKLHAMSLTVDSTQTTIFVYKENFDGYCKAIVSATDSVEKVLALKEKYQTFGKELLDSLAACTENINAETFINFMNAYRKYTAGLMITTSLGRIHHEIYIAKLKELGYDDSQIASVIATTTYPVEKTPFFNSQIDLLKIGIEIQDNHADETRVNSLIAEWMSRHAFVPVNFCEEPYSEMDLRNLLEEVLKNNCQEKLDSLERQHEESIENANKELEKIADAEVNRLSKTLAEITTINEFRKNVFCKTSLGYRPIFTVIAQKLGSDNWRDIFYLTSEEILKVLNGETLSLDQVVQSRKKVAMYINDEGKLTFLDTATTQGLYDVVYSSPKTNLESSKIIKGLSANKGKVKGVAKVILSSKEFSKLLPNEILVTTMTSVDFVPIMERAAAFITNEGGITSHASIVARELNKPCIIGTKNATQIIKDGDIVEVDADKGVITIF